MDGSDMRIRPAKILTHMIMQRCPRLFQNGNLQKALKRYLHKPDSAVHDHYCSQQNIDKRMRGFQRDNRDIKSKGPGTCITHQHAAG